MNAPWKPGGALRDPFHAFVCDDHSFDVLRAVAAEMGWAPEKVNKGGMRNAVQTLSITASPQILFVDMSESGDPLNDINSLAEVCEHCMGHSTSCKGVWFKCLYLKMSTF